MKRIIILALLLLSANVLAQTTDTSKFIWSRDGKLYIGNEAFQRWSGHFWDTLATKRYARSVGGGGGGGGGSAGDTVLLNGTMFYILKYVPERLDSVYGCIDLNGTIITTGDNVYATSTVRANDYPNPPGSNGADTMYVDMRVVINASCEASSPPNLAGVYVYPEIWREDLGEWKQMSDAGAANTLGMYPWWDEIAHQWHITTADAFSYYVGGWAKYKQYYGYPKNTFWDWGIEPLQNLTYRFRAQALGVEGRTTAVWGQETIGEHTGSIFWFGPKYYWPAYYRVVMTVDTSGTIKTYGDIDATNGTVFGTDAQFSYAQLGYYPDRDSSKAYIGYPDTVAGYLYLLSAATGTATIGASGGDASTGFNQAFWVKIDTITGLNDTLQTYGHSVQEAASHTRLEHIQADSNVTFTMNGSTLKIKTQPSLKYAGTTTNLKYVTLDSNMVAHVSGDTLHLAATAGGTGATGASFYTNPSWKPPASPSSFNDEFDGANGTGIDTTTKWKWLGTNANHKKSISWQVTSGALVITDTMDALAATLYNLLGQKITDSVWTFTVCFKASLPAWANYMFAGVFVWDSTSGKGHIYNYRTSPSGYRGYSWHASQTASQTTYLDYNNGTTWNWYEQWSGGLAQYIRISRTAARYIDCYFSQDGISWNLFDHRLATTYLEGTTNRVDWIGICVGGYNGTAAVGPGQTSFYWFRYNWTADFDPTISN